MKTETFKTIDNFVDKRWSIQVGAGLLLQLKMRLAALFAAIVRGLRGWLTSNILVCSIIRDYNNCGH